MKIEINKLEDEYRLEINYSNRIEVCYIKDLHRLLEYILINTLYAMTGKSEFYSRKYAKVSITYEKEEWKRI